MVMISTTAVDVEVQRQIAMSAFPLGGGGGHTITDGSAHSFYENAVAHVIGVGAQVH